MNIKDKLYIATIAEDAKTVAEKYGLGIEINEFCTAVNMDEGFACWDKKARDNMSVTDRLIFHAPFNEIHPSAIDPLARKFALSRLNQAYKLAKSYGIRRMVVHSGFLPEVYFPVWFIDRSVEFWQEFMSDKPSDFRLMIENQLEPQAELLPELCEKINHPGVSLCLDTGHALYKSEQDINYWADCFAPFCTHLHLHNNDKSWDLHWCLNRGLIDMSRFLPKVLAEMPRATITLEHLKAEASLVWLQEKGYI
ncbi:MAG: sugar phosphate isomerase/epimerase family protein [Bacillota bacterium]|jgi:sugar phosphate isomerase/epimerase